MYGVEWVISSNFIIANCSHQQFYIDVDEKSNSWYSNPAEVRVNSLIQGCHISRAPCIRDSECLFIGLLLGALFADEVNIKARQCYPML